MAAQQQRIPRRGEGYPSRPPFFYNRFSRLMTKVCAAQHIGPDGAWFVSRIASLEDSAKYKHAIAWTDEQAAPMIGRSPSQLKRIRARCVQHGWLHYEQGFKGVPSLYWVVVPPAYDILDGAYMDDELEDALRIRAQLELESRPKADGIRTACELESGPKADASIPRPTTSTSTSTSDADGGGFEKSSRHTPCAVANAADGTRSVPATLGGHAAPTEPEALTSDQPNAQQFAELQTRLRGVGVDLAEKTLLTALSVGHTVGSINAVIKHAEERPGWWGGGAVRLRLTNRDSVTLAVDRGWAKPEEKAKARWESHQRKAADAAKLDALGAKTDEPAPKQKEWDWAELERQYAAEIDAASVDELIELLPDSYHVQARRDFIKPNGRRQRMYWHKLLVAFATRGTT